MYKIKNVQKGVFPLYEVILGIWGIYGENGVQSWPRRESEPAEKRIHHPLVVISEVLQRVDFALPACLRLKSTLGRTSEMTPDGGVPFSLLVWIPWEAGMAHRFHRKSPKSPKSAQKEVTRFFDHFLVKAPLRRRHYAPPVSRTAGGAIKGTPQGNRRYILLNPIRAISDVTFLTFFEVLPPIWGLYPY